MITTKDVQVLVGTRVELVCFAQFSVYIHFEGQIALTLEADFEHVFGDTYEHHVTTFPAPQSSLMRLLACLVISATVDTSRSLQLIFSNGDSLTVLNRPEFESYRLKIGNEELFA